LATLDRLLITGESIRSRYGGRDDLLEGRKNVAFSSPSSCLAGPSSPEIFSFQSWNFYYSALFLLSHNLAGEQANSLELWAGSRARAIMRKKILIVEDNTKLLEMLRLTLKDAGLAVATATNGIEALRKARSIEPDLMVLDLVLPELDGFAVCETLRRDPALSGLPIIALTGLTSEISRYSGLESGASEYVTKPFNPGQLVSLVHHWLRQPPSKRKTLPNPAHASAKA
jgi:CheY-like chemotaxis protein